MKKYESIESAIFPVMRLPVGGRTIRMVILHHTWRPNHAQWNGDETAVAIRKFWFRRRVAEGWSQPPGGHFIVSPSGEIYVPFDDLSRPLNANSDRKANRFGVSIEAVGDFDVGQDVLTGAQKHAVIGLIGTLLLRFSLQASAVEFHRCFPAAHKSCPGSSLALSPIRNQAAEGKIWAMKQMVMMKP